MLTSCHGGLRLERTMEEFSPASHQLAVKKSLVLTGAAIMVFPPLQTRKCHNLKISDHTRYNQLPSHSGNTCRHNSKVFAEKKIEREDEE